MPELNDKQKSGVDFITSVMGEQFGTAFRSAAESDRFGSLITRMAASWAFHDVWQHEGLTRKEKSLVTIAALIASRQPLEAKNHVKIGLANGLTASELEGLLIQLSPYLGFPSVASGTTAVVEAMREAGADPEDLQTAEEQGLL